MWIVVMGRWSVIIENWSVTCSDSDYQFQNLKLKVALKTGNKMADNEDRVGFIFYFILWQTINIRCWGQHKSARVVKENDDLGLPTIYSYPGNRSKSRVWKYFGFLKLKQGPPTRENLDISKALCRYCKKEYAIKIVPI